MPDIKNIYEVRIASDFDQWWRYNTFLTIAGYGSDGTIVSYKSTTDKIYEVEGDATERFGPPPGYRTPRVSTIVSDPCSSIEIYFYAIANTFPISVSIKDSPPFDITIEIFVDGKLFEKFTREANQWGGLTIAGLKIEKSV